MRNNWTIFAAVCLYQSLAHAQSPSLGGYGTGGSAMSGMPSGVAPFAGRFGAMMPSRLGDVPSFRPRPSSMSSGSRAPFSIGPAMGSNPMDRSFSLPASSPLGSSRRSMPSPGVMPPRFGSPFREPPSLVPTSSGSAMAM